MKKVIAILILLLGIAVTTSAQSMYHFRYAFKTAADTTSYDAFFFIDGSGGGWVRIKYRQPQSGKDVLVEMTATEDYPKDAGQTGTQMFYRFSSPLIINGDQQALYTQPVFWFGLNTASGYYEPLGVRTSTGVATDPLVSFQQSEPVTADKLTKDFVSQYFTPQDDFYRNKFVNGEKALTPDEKNVKIFMIVVANVKDESIGASCAYDMRRTIETFSRLATLMGFGLDTSAKVYGDGYNKQNVDNAIDGLKPGKKDIVVFYYTGHGFRKPNTTGYYPFLDLRAKIEARHADNVKSLMVNSLYAEDILDRIRKKGARLNLVITDCCNSHYDSANCKAKAPPATKDMPLDIYRENGRKLFLNPTPQSILFAAASPGEKAISNNALGSFFSYYFKLSIENNMSYFTKNASWEKVFADAKAQTTARSLNSPMPDKTICEQTPITNLAGQ